MAEKEDRTSHEPSLGTGVDRTLIRQRLSLTPGQRARLAVEEARKLQAFRERLRR